MKCLSSVDPKKPGKMPEITVSVLEEIYWRLTTLKKTSILKPSSKQSQVSRVYMYILAVFILNIIAYLIGFGFTFHERVNMNNVSVISMRSKTTSVVQLLAWSLRLWYIIGSSPGRVEPKIINLESGVSPLSTQH